MNIVALVTSRTMRAEASCSSHEDRLLLWYFGILMFSAACMIVESSYVSCAW